MEQTGADFTNSFRCLSRVPLPSSSDFTEKLATVKNYLLSQCCTAEELKKANSPRIDPRSVTTLYCHNRKLNTCILLQLTKTYFYAPSFEEIEEAYWFGPVRPSMRACMVRYALNTVKNG